MAERRYAEITADLFADPDRAAWASGYITGQPLAVDGGWLAG